ncbi:MAG: hypothetical protein AABZ60_00855 [Planctomycetota bacterium]
MSANIKKTNLLKKLFKFFLAFCLGCIVLMLYLSYQRSQRVAQLLQEYKQSGYATSLKEINEKYVLPPVNDNGAIVIESAIAKLKEPEQTLGDKSTAKKNYLTYEQTNFLLKPIALGESLSKEVKIAIGKHLVQNEEALKLLRQGLAMKQFRYCPDYTEGVNAKITPFLGMRKMINLLKLKTLFHLENGESEDAVQSVLEGFALAQSFSNDPMLIMNTIQMALIQFNIESLEYVLNRMDISEKNILDLSSLLQTLEEPESLARCYVTDFCMGLEAFNDGSVHEGKLISHFSVMIEEDKIFYLEKMKIVIDTSYSPLQERMKKIQFLKDLEKEMSKSSELLQDLGEKNFNSSNFFHSGTQSLVMGFYYYASFGLRRIMILRNAQIALAVERYRLANQKLPEQLSELVPAYLKEELLLDLFDNKLVHYKKLSKGYLIYSVGEDAKDNGGKKKENENHSNLVEEYDLVFTVNR